MVSVCVCVGTRAHKTRCYAEKNGVDYHALLQGIFPAQGLNLPLLCLLHCRQIHYPLSHLESPCVCVHVCTSVEKFITKNWLT